MLRRLIGVAGEIAELGYDEPDDVDKAIDRGRVDGVRDQPAAGRRLRGQAQR